MSVIVIDQDQYTPAVYYGGMHTFTGQQIGTRYLVLSQRGRPCRAIFFGHSRQAHANLAV